MRQHCDGASEEDLHRSQVSVSKFNKTPNFTSRRRFFFTWKGPFVPTHLRRRGIRSRVSFDSAVRRLLSIDTIGVASATFF